MSAEIIILHGPYSLFQTVVGNMPEGEPCEVGVPAPDGSCLEWVYVGGHDGQNKMQGSGAQVWEGDVSAIAGPPGAFVVKPSAQALQICAGGTTWFTLTPNGSSGTITGTVDGGTWV